MPDTLTPNILLTNQTEGGNDGSWGTIADTNFEYIDDKFGDTTDISTTGGTTVLTATQERVNAIQVAGAALTPTVLQFSGKGGSWVIENNQSGSQTLTCKCSGQPGVTVERGSAALVWCDGTDIRLGNPPPAVVAEVTVASATTTNILGAASEFVAISGTTAIASFGTGASRTRFVRATGAFLITHSASLICPGGRSIQAAAGDTFLVVSDASSNARIWCYERAAIIPSLFPVGSLVPYAGSTEPTGWLFCYGQNVSRTTYAALFAIIGVTYGSGDGTTTFTLPDLRGRVIACQDDVGGTSANRLTGQPGGLNGDTLGATGGAERHTLDEDEIPEITPTGTVALSNVSNVARNLQTNNAQGGSGSDGVDSYTVSTPTASFSGNEFGGGESHNNVQPTIILNYIMFAGV